MNRGVLRDVTRSEGEDRGDESEKTTSEDTIEPLQSSEELVSKIRRLTTVMLEKLEEGSKEKTIDHTQMRLIGAITLRALRLWEKTLRPTGKSTRKINDKVQELNGQVHAILGDITEESRKDAE